MNKRFTQIMTIVIILIVTIGMLGSGMLFIFGAGR